jgi:hypothetical protein
MLYGVLVETCKETRIDQLLIHTDDINLLAGNIQGLKNTKTLLVVIILV